MMQAANRLVPMLCAALLAGCLGTTPASNYYLLEQRGRDAPTGSGPAVGVGPVTLPDYLKRSGIAFQPAPNALEVSLTERWAEPLDSGIQRVLSLNLASLLDTQSIQVYPWPRSRSPDFTVRINVLQLDSDRSRALLVAEWVLGQAGGGPPLERRLSRLEQSFDGQFTVDRIPAAYSELVYRLSREIAAAIESRRPG